MKWVPGSLGEGLAWLQPPTPDTPARPTSPICPGTSSSWGQEVRGRAFSLEPSKAGSLLPQTHTQHAALQLPRPGEGGGVHVSTFFSPKRPEEGASSTTWGCSRAGHWGTSPGGAPILPFALDECALTPSPPPHPLNKQHHPPHPLHTQRHLVPE